jgi:hypothetical protein
MQALGMTNEPEGCLRQAAKAWWYRVFRNDDGHAASGRWVLVNGKLLASYRMAWRRNGWLACRPDYFYGALSKALNAMYWAPSSQAMAADKKPADRSP